MRACVASQLPAYTRPNVPDHCDEALLLFAHVTMQLTGVKVYAPSPANADESEPPLHVHVAA